jgi:hypothetical protein
MIAPVLRAGDTADGFIAPHEYRFFLFPGQGCRGLVQVSVITKFMSIRVSVVTYVRVGLQGVAWDEPSRLAPVPVQERQDTVHSTNPEFTPGDYVGVAILRAIHRDMASTSNVKHARRPGPHPSHSLPQVEHGRWAVDGGIRRPCFIIAVLPKVPYSLQCRRCTRHRRR